MYLYMQIGAVLFDMHSSRHLGKSFLVTSLDEQPLEWISSLWCFTIATMSKPADLLSPRNSYNMSSAEKSSVLIRVVVPSSFLTDWRMKLGTNWSWRTKVSGILIERVGCWSFFMSYYGLGVSNLNSIICGVSSLGYEIPSSSLTFRLNGRYLLSLDEMPELLFREPILTSLDLDLFSFWAFIISCFRCIRLAPPADEMTLFSLDLGAVAVVIRFGWMFSMFSIMSIFRWLPDYLWWLWERLGVKFEWKVFSA